jgi:AraC-like DNA-binding protein
MDPAPHTPPANRDDRWNWSRGILRLVCPHAKADVFEDGHLGRNRIDYHRLFIIPPDSPATGSRVVDEAARKSLPLDPSTVILLPHRRLYRFEFKPGFRIMGFHFRLEAAPGHDVLGDAVQWKCASITPEEAAQAWRASSLHETQDWLRYDGLLRWHIGQMVSLSWEDLSARMQIARSWKTVLDHLGNATASDADIAKLALRAGCSREHFSRRFRARFGVNPRTWHRQQLAARAVEQLLTTDEPVNAIAGQLGFSDQFAFSKFVRRFMGLSPTELRRKGPWG